MTRLLVAFAVLSVSGCLCAKECMDDSDCTDGAICGGQKLCEARPDGGTGGGSVGGGSAGGGSVGGGSGGGATGGGMTGGGTGGGMPPGCMPVCAVWEACIQLADAGLGCLPGVLVVTSPAEGEEVRAGGDVSLLARLELQDGGAWPVSTAAIPVATSWSGVAPPVRTGVASTVGAPGVPSMGVVTFGWDAGLDAGPMPSPISRNVNFTDCVVAVTNTVQPWEKCVPTVTGGRREAVVLSVAFSSPIAGTTFGPDAGVATTVVLTVASDAGAFAGAVPWSGGTLSGSGNTRSGTAVTPMLNRPFTMSAGWDGGPSGSVTVQVDAVGPVLTWKLQVDGGVGGGKRDERVFVQLESNEALQAAPAVAFEDAGVSSVNSGACSGWSCDAGRCDCYELDLAVPDLAQMTGTFGLQASARDVYGNASTTSSSVPVTRLRWRANVGVPDPVGNPLRAAPALDSAGNIYVAPLDNGTTGRLVSLNPIDGGLRTNFPINTGAVQSISIGQSRIGAGMGEVVYLNSNVTAGSRIDMFTTDGGPTGTSLVDVIRKSYSALALFRTETAAVPEVGAAAIFNTVVAGVSDGQVGSAAPQQTDTSSTNAEYMLPLPGSSAPFSPVNAIVFARAGGDQLVFPTDDGNAPRGLSMQRFVSGSWQVGGSSPGIGTAGSPVGLCAAGDSAFLAMTNRFPALVVSKSLQLPVDLADAGAPTPSPLTTFAPALAARASGATAIFGTNFAGPTNSNWLFSSVADPSGPTLSTPVGLNGAPSATRLVTSPVIGGGGLPHGVGGSADRLFTVTQDGTLRAFVLSDIDGVAGASPEWVALAADVVGAGKTVYAHPTLDCGTRPFVAGRPGVLYVVATDGTVAAILVDSSKLSTTAPWPKWQRTAGNAGNDDEGLFPRNPGCN